MQIINYSSWLQGQYHMAAISAALSKRGKYPKQPFELEKKENSVSGEEKFKLWVHAFNQRFA